MGNVLSSVARTGSAGSLTMKKINQFIAGCLGLLLLLTSCSSPSSSVSASQTAYSATDLMTAAMISTVTPTQIPVCLTAGGHTEQVKFPSTQLKETFTATIYLPPCYDAGKSGGYPVLYLFHGQNMDDTFWPSLGVTSITDQAILNGHTPFIMVFPYEVHNWDPPAGSHFGDAVMQDLIPWVENHYAVCRLRQCRAIGGLSRGGGWAMHIGLTNLDQFSAIGGHSLGYFSGDLYRIENLLTTHSVAEFPRIYIDRGEDDYLKADIDLYEQNLTYAGITHVYRVSPGLHNQDYWQSQVQVYMDWYMQGFDAAVQ